MHARDGCPTCQVALFAPVTYSIPCSALAPNVRRVVFLALPTYSKAVRVSLASGSEGVAVRIPALAVRGA
jgi:hypothetical protein